MLWMTATLLVTCNAVPIINNISDFNQSDLLLNLSLPLFNTSNTSLTLYPQNLSQFLQNASYIETVSDFCDNLSCLAGVEVGPAQSCPYNHIIRHVDPKCTLCLNSHSLERCVPCPAGKWCPTPVSLYECVGETLVHLSEPLGCDQSTFPQCGQCHNCTGRPEAPLLCASGSPPVEYCGGTLECSSDCGPGKYTLDMQTCLDCEVGFYCPDGLRRHKCPPGHLCSDSGTVGPRECEPGFWCDGSRINTCPYNSWAQAAAPTQRDCVCLPGYTGSKGGLCRECPMDHWCPGETDFSPCTLDALSPHMSTSASDCYCQQGFRKAGSPHGTESFVCDPIPGSEAQCSDPAGMVPLLGTDDCVCRPGYHRRFAEDGSDGCVLCPENYFCSGGERLGEQPPRMRRRSLLEHGLESCPANSTAPEGTNHSQGCMCDRGYYGPLGGPCELCPANSWCWGGVENLCPFETPISPAGVSWPENCTCVLGEYCNPINKQVDVSSYARGQCYIDAGDDGLYCWGMAFDEWYNQAGQMYRVPLPPGRHAIDVKVGSWGDPDTLPVATYVCAHLDDLTVKCWGSNVGGILGSNYSNILNGTYPSTTDSVRALNGLQIAPNFLVYANSGWHATDTSRVHAHFCGLNDADRTTVTCWGTKDRYGWDTTKNFPTPVRGLFSYTGGTFAVLQDNSVYQWGEYSSKSGKWVKGIGSNVPQSFRRWYPTKQVRSIIPVSNNVCFHFSDNSFSCAGWAARNLDSSNPQAIATPDYFPPVIFGGGNNGAEVESIHGHTSIAWMLIHYKSDQLALKFIGGRRDVALYGGPLSPDPLNPIISLAFASIFSSPRTPVTAVRADGSWAQWGADQYNIFPVITGKTGAIPLLEYGMPETGMCECTLCEGGFFCPDGDQRQQCPNGETTIPPLGSVDQTHCVPSRIYHRHIFSSDCLVL